MKRDTEEKIFTYRAGLRVEEKEDAILSAYATLFSSTERSLFAEFMKGTPILSLKSAYLTRYQITARQFNAIRICLEGKIDAIKASLAERIEDLHSETCRLEKKIPKVKSERAKHEKSRRLESRKFLLTKLKKEEEEGVVSLCFGGKKLFNAQFHLEENGYASHEEWKEEWEAKRNSEFFCIGSSDETGGNQSCVFIPGGKEGGTLRVRLPNALTAIHGKYLVLEGVFFKQDPAAIEQALKGKKAISYRFKKSKGRWTVFASFAEAGREIKVDARLGAIGIDLNADHIAIIEADRNGNPLESKTIPLVTYGKTKDQAKALVQEAVKEIVLFALERKKPIVIENLDFKKKKTSLRETSNKYARMLSSFGYSLFFNSLDSRCYREGVSLFKVNPAYTSIIGRMKFALRYGLSTHHAAALCIARRYYKFSEAPTQSTAKAVHKNFHVTLSLPVRNRERHVWKFWADVKRKFQAALAAHYRASRSPCSP